MRGDRMKKLTIGTRGSELALWQARFIREKLAALTNIPTDLKIIKTTGDRIDDVSFSKMEGKGFFTKEIEEELLSGGIDLAVHSLKDLQTELTDGLQVGAVCFRVDPRERVLIRPKSYDESQPLGVIPNGTIGTSSVRRQCQIADLMPNLTIKDLRGNVPTRVNKLRDGLYDAIIIADAGLGRIEHDISDLRSILLDVETFVPAPAQGMLGIEIRSDDLDTREIVSKLDEPDLRVQVRLERGLLEKFEGGCQLPLGAVSSVRKDAYHLRAVFGIGEDGAWKRLRRTEVKGNDPESMVNEAYLKLTTE